MYCYTGKDDFITGIRKALTIHYGDKPVGLGGVFQIVNGTARLHIMSEFCDYPLETMDKINNWLQFFHMKAPLICLSAMVSYDAGEFGIRLEHTHCFSHHGEGGHYHYDTTPEEVEYLGYFNLAKQVFQYDQPPKST
ncbi:Ester hydrolase [Oopsacas minuta]|uniref:Ester hydrolase n=1 Tax=Oopsacas minuta TaxID=111878 RepID=A0AAV7JCP9_9METZ|nr:Ester hydrolase [Oopsacas minuta]